jgi:hypothetical protein
MVKAVATMAVITMLSICSIPLQIIEDVSADPTYGVRLTPKYDPETGETEPLMKSMGLREEAIFIITVTNVGSGVTEQNRDLIYLRIENSTIPYGWWTWMDTPPDRGNNNPDFVRLASDESTTIVLHVSSPWVGWSGDTACINITGNSSNDHSAIDTISLYAVLNVSVDFDLQFMKASAGDPLDPWYGKKYDKINPGAKQQYIISISNKGDLNDTYELNLSEPSDGWDWYFNETGSRIMTIELSSQLWRGISGATIAIGVECPTDALAYEEGTITVTAWSRVMEDHGENMTRSDDLKIVTNSIVDFFLTLDNDTFYCGQSFVVECTIHSLANRDIKVRLSADGVPSGWIIRYPEEDILVPWNGSTTVSISIITSPYTTNKRYANIQIEARWSSFYRYANITLVNGWEGKFKLAITQNFTSVLPGESSGASLKIISNYDRSMNVTVEVSEAPQGWSVKLKDGIGPVDYTLGPWGEDWIPISVMVPNDALMGEYRINITARSNQLVVNLSLPISIGQVHGFDLGYYLGDYPHDPTNDTFAIPANVTDQVWFFVENLGNGPERVNLVFGEEKITGDLARWDIGIVSVGRVREDMPDVPDDDMGGFNLSDLPRGFEYSTLYYGRGHRIVFRDIGIGLGAYETAWVRILLGAPGPEIMKLMDSASLVSLVRTGSETLYCNVTLSVLYPDLEVGNVTILGPEGGPPVHNRNVTVGITVRNNGTCRANDILVMINAGGSIVARGRIPSIGPGGSELIELSFIASKYIRDYTIEIDPDNEIIESADQFMENGTNDNNLYSITIDVEELEKEEGGTSAILFWVMAILTIVVLITGTIQLLSIRRKRRRTKDVFVEE